MHHSTATHARRLLLLFVVPDSFLDIKFEIKSRTPKSNVVAGMCGGVDEAAPNAFPDFNR